MIYASLTAYGEKGPEAEREGFDGVAYWTRSGLAELVRAPGAPPGPSVAGMGDHPTAVALFACILMGLYKRQLTGEGSMVSTSLLANGFWANGCMGSAALVDGYFPMRNRSANQPLPWIRVFYQTKDGRLLQLNMIRQPYEQETMFRLMGLEHLLADERYQTMQGRLIHSGSLQIELQHVFQSQTSEEWLDLFHTEGLNISRLATVDDMLTDEQAIANDVLVPPVDDLETPYVINPPLFMKDTERVGPKHAPQVGEHTEEILTALGYDEASIAELFRSGVI